MKALKQDEVQIMLGQDLNVYEIMDELEKLSIKKWGFVDDLFIRSASNQLMDRLLKDVQFYKNQIHDIEVRI